MTLIEKLKSGALWNFIGFAFRFIIGLGSSILFVRLLGQHDYGVVTFTLSWVYFAGILCNFGLGNVLVQAIAEERSLDLTETKIPSLMRKILIIQSIALIGVAIAFQYADAFASAFGKPQLAPFLYFVPFLVTTALFQGVLKTTLDSFYEQKLVNILSVWEIILKLGFVIMAIQLGYGIIGFLVAILTVQSVTGGQMILTAWKRVFEKKQSQQTFDLKSKLPIAANAFLVSISERILGRESDLLLLGMLHPNIREVAIYAVACGLPNTTFTAFHKLIGGGLGLTVFTEFVKTNQWDAFRTSYAKILHLFSILLFPIIVGGILMGGELATLMYGGDYIGLGLPIATLFACLGIGVIRSVTIDMLYAFGWSQRLMYTRLGFGILNIIGNILVIPKYGAVGVALVTGAVVVGITLTEFGFVHYKLKPNYPIPFFIKYFLSACLMGLVVIITPLPLFGKIGIGMVVYAGLLFLFRKGDPVLKSLLHRKK